MMKVLLRWLLLSLFMLLISSPAAWSLRLPLPPSGSDVFGQLQFAVVKTGDTFTQLAEHYDVGFYELAAANPEVNPQQLTVGTVLIIPNRHILPHVPHRGIVINVATMRLYYFPTDQSYFYTFPVGIGKRGWNTPLGVLHITQKIKHPVWLVPNSIYEYRQQHGDPVPHVMPAGPNNPLGDYALRLSKPTYLIHGTNDPSSVGRRSSAGCIHLYPKDIKQLFLMVAPRTRVLIINQPYKIGWNHNQLLIEAHLPLIEERAALANTSADVVALVNSMHRQDTVVNWQQARQIIKDHVGIPLLGGYQVSQPPQNR